MKHGKIYVAGIGPGSEEDITPAVRTAIMQSNVVVGYKYYFNFIRSIVRPETECIDTGMKKEKDRAALAFEYAEQGRTVCVVSSGDAGIYGMVPLVLEMKRDKASDVEVEILPGISAFQKGAALLGAPIGHDFCIISLSDPVGKDRVSRNSRRVCRFRDRRLQPQKRGTLLATLSPERTISQIPRTGNPCRLHPPSRT